MALPPGWNQVPRLISLVDFSISSCLLSAALTWLLESLPCFSLERKGCGPIMSLSGGKGGAVRDLGGPWGTSSWLITAILLGGKKEARGLTIRNASS